MFEFNTLKKLVLACQTVLLLVSIAMVYFTFFDKAAVTPTLQGFAVDQLEKKIDDVIERSGKRDDALLVSDKFEMFAKHLQAKAELNIAKWTELKSAWTVIALGVKSGRCIEECKVLRKLQSGVDTVIGNLGQDLQTSLASIQQIALDQYDDIIDGFLNDIRVVGLANVAALLLSLLVFATGHSQSKKHVVFSMLLTAIVAWSLFAYFFEQDWVYVFLTQSWTSQTYACSMAVYSLMLVDILFLKARISGFLASAVGSVFS